MSSLSKSFRLSSTLKIEEEAMAITKNQGIGSILGSDFSDKTSTKSSSSLRRTLSADMSSTKWMKKIASSEEFSICSITDSSSDEEEEEAETEPRSQFDIWSSLIQQKSQELTDNKPLPPPYIHPLVKRSASSLSQKSLQICTESLGSETGSDGFSSYPASESGEDEKETETEQNFENFEQVLIPKYNYVATAKKLPQRSFPPPIPSRASVRMQSRRDNGKLVLEAVSVPCTNNFLAQRQDGRLVLTFTTEVSEIVQEEEEKREVEEELEEEFESFDGDESEEATFDMELQAPKLSSRVINVHKLTLMGLANRDPSWPNKFNEVVKFDEVEGDIKPAIVAKSLPPMARLIPKSVAAVAAVGMETAAAAAVGGGGASFNTYEYFWRPKPMTTRSKEQQQLLVLRGNKGDYNKSCKEPKRSLLFWEPHCIATS